VFSFFSLIVAILAVLAAFASARMARTNAQQQIRVATREAWMREFREQISHFLGIFGALHMTRNTQGTPFDQTATSFANCEVIRLLLLQRGCKCQSYPQRWKPGRPATRSLCSRETALGRIAMPIRPELRRLYPPHWRGLSSHVRFERAGGRCQRCRRPHLARVRCLPDVRALWRLPAVSKFDADMSQVESRFRVMSKGSAQSNWGPHV